MELELHDFVRAKDAYDMSVDEKIASQVTRCCRCVGRCHVANGVVTLRAPRTHMRIRRPSATPVTRGAQAAKKERGNVYFKRGELKEAIGRYEKSNTHAPTDKDWDKSEKSAEDRAAGVALARKTKLSCYLNIAASQLRLDDAAAAVTACTSALEIDAQNAKALYRRGQAQMALGEIGAAKTDLLAAARLDPKSREVRNELEALKAKREEGRARDKAAFGGMFQGPRQCV